jgi:hypothetical protein
MRVYKTIFLVLLAIVFVGCSQSPAPKEETPTGVLKKYLEAAQKKDVEVMKQTLSAGTLKMIDESAKKQGTTVEELLKKDDGTIPKEMPETRNEQIQGDTATVEVRNGATADWDKIPFVKEDGKWKLALDKFMQDLMRKVTEGMKTPEIPRTNDSKTPPATSSKKP